MPGPVPYLSCRNAGAAIDFYGRAFAAEVIERHVDTDGRIGHAELRIGGGVLYLADEYPEIGFVGPATLGGVPLLLALVVADVDAAFRRACEAGATALEPPTDEAHGPRRGRLRDPSGFVWSVRAA
jgi:PhnB protein